MNEYEYKNLKIGDKIQNFRGQTGKISYKRNKDCYYIKFMGGYFYEYLTKENYNKYLLIK